MNVMNNYSYPFPFKPTKQFKRKFLFKIGCTGGQSIVSDSVGQDQTARLCSLILIYTVGRTAGVVSSNLKVKKS